MDVLSTRVVFIIPVLVIWLIEHNGSSSRIVITQQFISDPVPLKRILSLKNIRTIVEFVKRDQRPQGAGGLSFTGDPRGLSIESYISRFYSINRGVISARYVGTEAVLQQFRLQGHKLFKALIENEDAAQLFLETVKSGKMLKGEKELQFFNALTPALFKVIQE